MSRLALALLCACAVGIAAAAGGKAGAKGKRGALLSAARAPATAPAALARGGGTVVLGTGLAAGRAQYLDPRNLPPLDPERDVSEQDCTQPVDLTRGNLKCK